MSKPKYGNNLPGRINYKSGEIAEIKELNDRITINKIVKPNLLGYLKLGSRKYEGTPLKQIGKEYFEDQKIKLIIREDKLEKLIKKD